MTVTNQHAQFADTWETMRWCNINVNAYGWQLSNSYWIQLDGMYKALLLEFGLPPSSYATMALREITKMDMSAQFQVTLNEAAGTKTEPATKRWKPDQASCQPNSGGESIKKETDLLAKEEPVTTSELP